MRLCILGDARSVHVQRIARGLAGRGLDVTVITHHPTEIDGVRVRAYAVPPPGLRYPARWQTRLEMYLKRIMREHDVVQVHYLHDWGLTKEIVADGCLTVTPWGSDIQLPAEVASPPAELVRKRVAMVRMSTAIIATCQTFADAIVSFAGGGANKVRIVSKGVDTSLFAPPPKPADLPVVGYFKGFNAVNGARYLIEAMPAVLASCPGVRFEFAGDGPLLEDCRRMVETLGVADSVRFLGAKSHEDMPAVMSRWSAVAIPSLMEAFCVGALESAAMELPVVASNVGGLRETVRDGLTGTLVPPGDAWHLAEALIEMIEDPERGRLMGRAGRRVVREEYEWSDSLDRLIESYDWAVARAPVTVGR